ncbi:MAG TPA: hypothetical protein PLW12_09175, partial [Methanothrix sp.]|nr:hypothetical protein [Methanothrix sp.]HPO89449.1 hypothetical protein [Methanothrix sp.]
GGHMRSLTEHQRNAIIIELEKGATKASAIAVAGVDKESFIFEYNHNPEFRKKVDEIYTEHVSRVTPEVRMKFLDLLSKGVTFHSAAFAAGVNAKTMKLYCSQNPEFFELVKEYTKKYNPAQRMTAISYDQREVLIKLLRKGVSRSEACKQAGIPYATLTRYIARDEDMRNAVTEAELEACEKVESALFKNALEGNFNAQKFWLCNRAPDRWKDVSSRSSRDSGSTPIEVHVRNVFDDIDRLALEYERRFKEASARGLAPADAGSDAGGSGYDRLQGDGRPAENGMGKPVHSTYTVSPAA